MDWDEKGTLVDIYRKKYKTGYVPDTEHDRTNPKLGRRLDKFLVSEDLNIKETTIMHVSDNIYKQELNMIKQAQLAISSGFAVTYCVGLLSRTMHLKLFIFI